MPHASILSIEDDANLSLVMRHYLEEEGYKLTVLNEGGGILATLQDNQFDIILLDLGLPDVDGLNLIPQIRQKFNGPVIVISGKTGTTDRVVGLELGADDYMTKPFEMRELVARIKANLRRSTTKQPDQDNNPSDTPSKSGRFVFGEWMYDAGRYELRSKNGDRVELTSGECEMLHLFLTSNGRALSRDFLFEATRGGNLDAYDRSVDIQVTRLRKKLNDDPQSPQLIKTVRGVGYMFIGTVTQE